MFIVYTLAAVGMITLFLMVVGGIARRRRPSRTTEGTAHPARVHRLVAACCPFCRWSTPSDTNAEEQMVAHLQDRHASTMRSR